MSAPSRRGANSSQSGNRPAVATSSPPTFIKVLRRVANSVPFMKINSDWHVDALRDLYDEALKIIDSQDISVEDGHPYTPSDVITNIISFSMNTNGLNYLCKSVAVPFYDEDWVFDYWIPMARLVKPQDLPCTPFTVEGIKSAMDVFLKVDMPHLSSECKTEVLRVLGELLEIPDLNAARANDVVNIVIKTLFDERPSRAETRATRRATANVVIKSNIIVPFLKFLVSQPVEDEQNDEGLSATRDLVKTDICHLLGLCFTSILGEMDPEVVATHGPSFKKAIITLSPKLWTEIIRLGFDRMDFIDESTVHTEEVAIQRIRFFAVYLCFQCFAVLFNGSVDEEYMHDLQTMAYKNSRYCDKELDPDAMEHQMAVGLAAWVFKTKLPLSKKSREWFSDLAVHLAMLNGMVASESNNRAMLFNEATDFMGGIRQPMNPGDITKEEAEVAMKTLRDDQKRRGLLTEDEKSAVREAASGSSVTLTGAKCEKCHEEGVSGSNLKLMRCGGCKSVWYCSGKCQKDHWPQHKNFCKAKQAENRNKG